MQAKVGIIMGSQSDWPVMEAAAKILEEFQIPFEVQIVSAHRTPNLLMEYASNAQVYRGVGVMGVLKCQLVYLLPLLH